MSTCNYFLIHTFLQNTEGVAGYAQDLDHHMEETMKWAESVVSKGKPNIEKAQKKEYNDKDKSPTFKLETECGCTMQAKTLAKSNLYWDNSVDSSTKW